MEAIAIWEAVVLGLEIANSINTVITELESTLSIIETVNDRVNQIIHRLNHLRRESRIRFVPVDLMEAWLRYQRTCNATLRLIQDLLRKCSKRCGSRLAALYRIRFQYCGGKKELEGRLGSIQECNDYFGWLSETILNAPLIEDVMGRNTDAPLIERPILGFNQYVQSVMREEASREV
ncbi:hypothetical protein IFR05_007316 [Cadophora sp. M221]|nr:hypothetical protein IFR05_007316 [Cadophora sp. M221]